MNPTRGGTGRRPRVPGLLRRRTLLLATLAAAAGRAHASPAPPEVAAALPGAVLVGSGRLRFLGMAIYDARLWAAVPFGPGADYADVPLALELQYARRLVGRLIAERSIDEMRRVGEFDDAQARQWLSRMAAIFPDVGAGDRITGVQRPREAARFFVNGRDAGELPDPEFTRLFFGIWLAPQTSQPQLRDALLGR